MRSRTKLKTLARNLAWSWNKKYLKPLSRRRTTFKPQKGSTIDKLRRRRKALNHKVVNKNRTKGKLSQIKKIPKNERKIDDRSKNGESKIGQKSRGRPKKVQFKGTAVPRSSNEFELSKMHAKAAHLQGSVGEKTKFQTIGFKKDCIDYDNQKSQTIKTVYWSDQWSLRKNEESIDTETEYLPESDNESDRLPEFPRSPSPERPTICTFIRKGRLVDKPLYDDRGFCVSINGRMVKKPEISIPYSNPAKDAEEEIPQKDAEPPRKKLELPPLDELPTEFYDKNGKLIYKYRKPNVAGLLLLEAGLISFPDPAKNRMADLDFPGLRNERLLKAMKSLKFTD